jgi:glycosidase
MSLASSRLYKLSIYLWVALSLLPASSAIANPPRKPLYHLAPPNWYIGYKNNNLEIIAHGEELSQYKITLSNYPGVTLQSVSSSANRHIVYLQLNIDPSTKPGELEFNASPLNLQDKMRKGFSFTYSLKQRLPNSQHAPAIEQKDVTYLILPDRFCNGDADNDRAPVNFNVKRDRAALKGRHGGDIAGIQSKIPYLKDLGITTLWLNPVQENDQPEESFHGYAITDNYTIDPRLGSNKEYFELCDALIKENMKMVMDIVPNHLGDKHWMFLNFDTGWFNHKDSFVKTNYRAQTVMDPYASATEKSTNVDGWFVQTMPDLNQNNSHIATYLKQLYLWWAEAARLSGYRIDTYPYPDQNFMNDLVGLLISEYPKLTIFGETWVQTVPTQAAFCKNNINGFEKNQLPGITDFALTWAMHDACSKPTGWSDGLNKVYQTLSEDFLYNNPGKHCTFLDNHDLSRFYSIAGENFDAWKRGISLLFLMRGMPCIYYGTEILMTGKTEVTDANVRFDFPGGWNSDPVNKFTTKGRTAKENEAFNYIRTLAKLRQTHPALNAGKTRQYAAVNNTYVLVRYTDKSAVFGLFHQGDKSTQINLQPYAESLQGYTKMRNVFTGESFRIPEKLNLDANASAVFELLP